MYNNYILIYNLKIENYNINTDLKYIIKEIYF